MKLLTMFKGKVHRATVTQADLHYTGSLTLDPDLMEAADILLNEQVHVVNITNGSRLETYVIEGERGSGIVCLNGAAARLGQKGDLIIIITYCQLTPDEIEAHVAKSVHVDANNKVVRIEVSRGGSRYD